MKRKGEVFEYMYIFFLFINYFTFLIMVNARVSNETRGLLIRLIENDTTVSKAASTLNIRYRTAHRIWTKYQQTGVINKDKHGGFKGKLLTEEMIEGIRWTVDE